MNVVPLTIVFTDDCQWVASVRGQSRNPIKWSSLYRLIVGILNSVETADNPIFTVDRQTIGGNTEAERELAHAMQLWPDHVVLAEARF